MLFVSEFTIFFTNQILQAGEMREYGEPYQLLCDPNSYLLRLVEHTGPVAAGKLKDMAQTAHMHKMKNKYYSFIRQQIC